MISTWVDEQGLIDFADTGWYEAHIPKGMDKFLDACWIYHYTSILINEISRLSAVVTKQTFIE